MDINSVNFDPKHYVLNMLKQNTIKELLHKNNEIEEQIKFMIKKFNLWCFIITASSSQALIL